jgi:hypothetical protein
LSLKMRCKSNIFSLLCKSYAEIKSKIKRLLFYLTGNISVFTDVISYPTWDYTQ